MATISIEREIINKINDVKSKRISLNDAGIGTMLRAIKEFNYSMYTRLMGRYIEINKTAMVSNFCGL